MGRFAELLRDHRRWSKSIDDEAAAALMLDLISEFDREHLELLDGKLGALFLETQDRDLPGVVRAVSRRFWRGFGLAGSGTPGEGVRSN